MTSSQSAVSYSDQQLSKSYQQMSREAQEMKRRRRRRFQSQVTVEEADLMSNVEQEADNSKRNSEESDVVLKNQQMKKAAGALSVDVISSDITISRKIYQQRASTSRGNLEIAIAKRCRLHNSRKIPAGSNHDVIISVEEAGGSNHDVIISVEEAGGSNHDVIISVEEAGGSNLSHTIAAGVHLWSLGVLAAAGCGIGSVHEVVRSNLLVDPSEVEEGEM
ncbi:hypothetical protein F511_27283 [Dorcoceras hygrometricum]|uniref:Uncharacterized protein n=1 Tax=Dorcoceras hygrometricum TaxID=472368 RepID=A0A2Z7AQZ4_9LAMI|nr:hypothetical protein F511_27283 [Dorcoceras hygrometricum]